MVLANAQAPNKMTHSNANSTPFEDCAARSGYGERVVKHESILAFTSEWRDVWLVEDSDGGIMLGEKTGRRWRKEERGSGDDSNILPGLYINLVGFKVRSLI